VSDITSQVGEFDLDRTEEKEFSQLKMSNEPEELIEIAAATDDEIFDEEQRILQEEVSS